MNLRQFIKEEVNQIRDKELSRYTIDDNWYLYKDGNRIFSSTSKTDLISNLKNNKPELLKKFNLEVKKDKPITGIITLYRGIGHNEGNNFYSPSKEFALEFTRTGSENELRKISLDSSKIYKANPLPRGYGIEDVNFDKAIEYAKNKGFIGIWVDEGENQPNSVFIVNPKIKLYESTNKVKLLQKNLWGLENWFQNNSPTSVKNFNQKDWEAKGDEAVKIRQELFKLTGDYYGETKEDKAKQNIKPKGVDDRYDSPEDVPLNVYRWISKNTSILTSDASDAIRWSRIINTKNDWRYPSGTITVYRAVDNTSYNDIREGDWVTTDRKYAIDHNNRYFNGKGKVIEMEVDGKDVLVSPTGNAEEAIYAPLEYSIDINY